MTDRRLTLEKFNSHHYIKNETRTLQDKRTKYKETGPDQHTATTTAEYLGFVIMPIKTNRGFGALQQSPATQSLKS